MHRFGHLGGLLRKHSAKRRKHEIRTFSGALVIKFELFYFSRVQDLRGCVPSHFNIGTSFDKTNDAVFKGAQRVCRSEAFPSVCISKQEYLECGFDNLNPIYFI